MQHAKALILSITLLAAATATASVPVERVKSGILPAGGFYHLYEVTCTAGNTASIASLDRSTRWCTGDSADVSCFRRSHQAAEAACARTDGIAEDSSHGPAD